MELGKNPNNNKKYIQFLYGVLPVAYLGIVVAPLLPITRLLQHLTIESFYRLQICKDTPNSILICEVIYLCIYFFSTEFTVYDDNPFGEARWGTTSSLSKYGQTESKEYKEALKPKNLKKRLKPAAQNPDLKPVESKNLILSKNVVIDNETKTAKTNNNVLVVAGPGRGKTTSIVYANLMQLNGSAVICDPKAEATQRLVPLFQNSGYKVKILDLMNPRKSDRFNPFDYVKEDGDIVSMISFVFRGTDADKSGKSNDPFWDDANMLEMCAICYLLWYDARKEDRTLSMAMRLVNLNSKTVVRGENKVSALQALFDDFADRRGTDNLAMLYYGMLNKAKDKTLSNMETTLVAKMQLLLQPAIEDLMSTDELDLADIGRNKTALFLKVPATDSKYNFLVSVLYMFLYKSLEEVADIENMGNGCTYPVTIYEDEFTSFPQPANFLSVMRECRSRNIGIWPIFQEIPSLKGMKIMGDQWSAILGQVDAVIYMGSQEPETNKYVSESLLGDKTVTYKTKGSGKGGPNVSKTGKKLAAVSDLRKLPKGKEIICISGEDPVVDDIYPFLKHPNLMLTAIPKDGSGQPLYDRKEPYEHKSISVQCVKN